MALLTKISKLKTNAVVRVTRCETNLLIFCWQKNILFAWLLCHTISYVTNIKNVRKLIVPILVSGHEGVFMWRVFIQDCNPPPPSHGLNTDIDTKAFVSFPLKMVGRKVCGHLFIVQFTSNLFIILRCIWSTVQQPLLHLYRCLSTWAVVLHLDVSVYQSVCYTCTGLSTGAIVLPLEVSACLQEPVL